MERLKKFEGGTLADLKVELHDETNGYLIQTGLGPTNYEIKSEIIEEYQPTAEDATQKIESVRVTVLWQDPNENSIAVEGYILVNK